MKAWLVTWEWSEDSAAIADAVIAILNPAWSPERVMQIVEQIHAMATATLTEMALDARRPGGRRGHARHELGRIVCGDDPCLTARVVHDLKVDADDTHGLETIVWTEPARYHRGFHGPELVSEPVRAHFTRRIMGPVSHASVWVADQGAFREGWENHRGVVYGG
jgi:hypothetical protein